MYPSKWIGLLVPILTIILIVVMVVFGSQSFIKSDRTLEAFLDSFASPLWTLIGGLAGLWTSYYFFFASKLKEHNDKYVKTCAQYDKFLTQLKQLNDKQVNNLMFQYTHVLNSSDLFMFDSSFIKLAEQLNNYTFLERRRILHEIKNEIKMKYSEPNTCEKGCMSPNCPGKLKLTIYKAKNFVAKCPVCNMRYNVHLSSNNKVVFKSVPYGFKTITLENFEDGLHEYLMRIHADFSKEEIILMTKIMVELINANPKMDVLQIQSELKRNNELLSSLDDIKKVNRYFNILLTSQALVAHLSYTKPMNITVDEELLYTCYLKYVSYKIKTDKRAKVFIDKNIIQKLIIFLLPTGAFSEKDIGPLISDVLSHIGSAARSPSPSLPKTNMPPAK